MSFPPLNVYILGNAINLKIKYFDSQDHSYSELPINNTVSEIKQKIFQPRFTVLATPHLPLQREEFRIYLSACTQHDLVMLGL